MSEAPARAARPELRGLTGLRGVASLLVVVGHLHVANLPWLDLLELQNVAVDLFFALSAFTLLYVYADTPFRYGRFIVARIARVAPMNAAALLVATVLVGHESRWFGTGSGWWLDGIRQLLMVNGWPGIGSLKQWDLPAWSISVEALCYAVFPLWLVLDRALARASPSVLTMLALVLLTLSLYAAVFWFDATAYQWAAPPAGPFATAAGPVEGILGFMAGIATYRCWASGNIAAEAASRLCDAVVGALAMVCVLATMGILHRSYAVLLCPGLILGAAGGTSVTARVLASRPVHALGLISYALYLVHFPVKDAFAFFAPAVDPRTLPGYLAILACALVAGAACHVAIERPARLYLRGVLGGLGRPRVD